MTANPIDAESHCEFIESMFAHGTLNKVSCCVRLKVTCFYLKTFYCQKLDELLSQEHWYLIVADDNEQHTV